MFLAFPSNSSTIQNGAVSTDRATGFGTRSPVGIGVCDETVRVRETASVREAQRRSAFEVSKDALGSKPVLDTGIAHVLAEFVGAELQIRASPRSEVLQGADTFLKLPAKWRIWCCRAI